MTTNTVYCLCDGTGSRRTPDGGRECAACGGRLGTRLASWIDALPWLCVKGEPGGCGCPSCMPATNPDNQTQQG